MRSLAAAVCLVLFLGPVAGRAAPIWKGDPARAAEELEAQWATMADARATVPVRGTVRFALEATGIGWRPERVTAALQRLATLQDRDPASPTHGNFKWRSDQERVFDLNAVEFAMQQLALLHRQYARQLAPEARAALEAVMVPALAALASHAVRVEYTNIYVMKCWALLAAGEALDRPDVADDGYRRFDAWLRFTAQHGIGEYGAVTYYGIDLDSLALIAKFAGRPEARAKAKAAIRYLWTDIAAHWWAPGDRLGGANARSYDYLFGRGYLEAHTWTAGWLRTRPVLEGAGWLGGSHENQVVFRTAAHLPPEPAWTEGIRGELPRVVVQRWGDRPEMRAVHWVGRGLGVGSSGASRGSDERTLVVDLGNTPEVPQMVLFMDGRGDPYGTKKIANAANQAKALHLTPFLATVQRGPEVLQLLSDEPLGPRSRRKPGELAGFFTHLTIPAAAAVWIGDQPTEPGSTNQPVRVPAGAPVFVRLGQAVVGVRVLLGTATTGGPAEVLWMQDSVRSPARRLSVVHASREPAGRGTVAIWLRGAEGLDAAAFAAWRAEFATAAATIATAGNRLTIDVAGRAGPLRIEADPVAGERRLLAGGEPDALLGVNGRDLGRELLGAYAP